MSLYLPLGFGVEDIEIAGAVKSSSLEVHEYIAIVEKRVSANSFI